MDKIKAALVEMKSISRFETPEQREQCTGEPYPEEAAVRVLYDGKWELMEYWRAKQLEQDLVRLDKDFGDEFRRLPIVCDSGAVVPDRNWRPEEEE
jgi:hypothetical protein